MRVEVYRNLNRGGLSIRHKGKVIAYAASGQCVPLADCKFHVSAAASARIKNGENRSVHAWVKGEWSGEFIAEPTGTVVRYAPHTMDAFRDQSGRAYTDAVAATVCERHVIVGIRAVI